MTRGRRYDTPLFRFTIRPNKLQTTRFVFIVPKTSAKNAVTRNTLRRRASEWVRKNTPRSWSFDIAVFIKKEAVHATKKKFYEELGKISG